MANELNAQSVVDGLVEKLKTWIDASVRPLQLEIAALKQTIASAPAPKDGNDGRDGVSIDVDELRAVVIERCDAFLKYMRVPKDGEDGTDGRDGLRGEPGRDAVAIQIHPAIDEARSYPKNTYASHKAGLWRATSATHGMEGWECIMDGIADVKERKLDEREIESVYVTSSGREIIVKRTTAEMIYRGVWRDGAFKRGDVVTWGGSMWHCNEDTATRPETVEGAKAWTLCTKRGDKGRDAPQK